MVSSLQKAIALLLVVITLGLASCGGDQAVPVVLLEETSGQTSNPLVGAISEVSPPDRIQQLKPYLDVYEPQVRIAFPDDNDTLEDTTIAVDLQVRDLPIYKDEALELGPHLHLFLDDQPYQSVYEANTPITLSNLSPGTHTLRVMAVRPWGESFKNEGAYDQVTFNVFTASPTNAPDDSQPLLTLNQPQGAYGTEPILLDFYLKNAPLHVVAQEDETIADWQIRCTVNGEAFIFDRWQPIYLNGFSPGVNWVKLELIDENGVLIDNAFNTGIRTIEYTPDGDDSLSRLIRGEISVAQAKRLIDPNYVPPVPVIREETVSDDEATAADLTDDTVTEEVPPTAPLDEDIAPAPAIEESNATQELVESDTDQQELPTSQDLKAPELEETTETTPSQQFSPSDTESPETDDEVIPMNTFPAEDSMDQEGDSQIIDEGIDKNVTEAKTPAIEEDATDNNPTSKNRPIDLEASSIDPTQEDQTDQDTPVDQTDDEAFEANDESSAPESETSLEAGSAVESEDEIFDAEEGVDDSASPSQSDKSKNFDSNVLETPMELLEDEADLV